MNARANGKQNDPHRDPFGPRRRGPQPPKRVHTYHLHELGYRRKNQEDSFAVSPEYGLAAVADGMGGHEGGEVASKIAVQATVSTFAAAYGHRPHFHHPLFNLVAGFEGVARRAMREAHWHIQNLAKHEHSLAEMGTTLSFFGFYGSDGVIGHIGDSTIVRCRRRDQTVRVLSQNMRDEQTGGVVGLSARPELHMQVMRCSVEAGDRYLLFTDGVTDELPIDSEGMRYAFNAPDNKTCLEAIRMQVLMAGARDNFTAVAVDFVG